MFCRVICYLCVYLLTCYIEPEHTAVAEFLYLPFCFHIFIFIFLCSANKIPPSFIGVQHWLASCGRVYWILHFSFTCSFCRFRMHLQLNNWMRKLHLNCIHHSCCYPFSFRIVRFDRTPISHLCTCFYAPQCLYQCGMTLVHLFLA